MNDTVPEEGARTPKSWVKNSKQTWQMIEPGQNQQSEIQYKQVPTVLQWEKSMLTSKKLEWLASAAGMGLETTEDHKQIVNQQCHIAAKKPSKSHLGMYESLFHT